MAITEENPEFKELAFGTLAERLRFYRTECGFSQKEVADSLRIHRATYSYYELGRTEPSSENLIALARLFNVPIDAILPGGPLISVSALPVEDPGFGGIREDLSRVCDLNDNEKHLIRLFRCLTDVQQSNWLESIDAYGLRSQK